MKLVAQEAESEALRIWIASIEDNVVSSELARVELLRAVRRRDSGLIDQGRSLLRLTQLLALSASVFEDAGLLDPISLRSLDALHLASALSLGDELDGLVTYDTRMADAASYLGIHAFGPA